MRGFPIRGQVGCDEDAARLQPTCDRSEEVCSFTRVKQELRNKQGGSAVERLAGRQGFEVTGVKGTAIPQAVLLGSKLGDFHHAR